MPRRIGFVAAWVMVTLVAVAIAAQAGGSVRDQVTNRPSPIVDVSALAPTTTTPAFEPTTTLPPITSTSTTRPPETTTTSTTVVEGTTTTTTAAPESTTTTTTTAAPPTTTTTTAPPEMTTETREMVGGWVRIRYGAGKVFLDGAGANAGFTMKVEDNGPDEVEVEFRSESHKSQFSAEYNDDKLRVEVKEEGDDEDGGNT